MGLKPGGAQIQGASIEPGYRGLGLGKKMYGEVMRRMPGRRLSSDHAVSSAAERVWRGMRRRGYQVKENPTGVRAIEVAERYKRRFGEWPSARKPQFTASLPRKA
jgi:GNAT superfamily N-acetyltransferase